MLRHIFDISSHVLEKTSPQPVLDMKQDQTAHHEDVDGISKSPAPSRESDATFSEAEYRKIVHKIDKRLVTVVGVCPTHCALKVGSLTNTTIKVDVLRQLDGPYESCGRSCS